LLTFDDSISIKLKTQYAMQQKLGGIMFWQLTDDKPQRACRRPFWEATKEKVEPAEPQVQSITTETMKNTFTLSLSASYAKYW